jgi:hypothetical protein
MDTAQAYLVVFGTIGPSLLKVLAERVSISVGKAVSEVSRTVETVATTHTKKEQAVEPGD